MLEDAKRKAAEAAAKPAPAAPAKPEADAKAATPAAKPTVDSATPPPATDAARAKAAAAKTAAEPPTVLPKVMVNKPRITVLDQQIAEQDKDIAREKQNAKATELDKALNDPKVSKALSILGGKSSEYHETVAQERVKIMEDERDILEQMKLVKTKAEKEDLQKQLDELRAYRRALEQNLR